MLPGTFRNLRLHTLKASDNEIVSIEAGFFDMCARYMYLFNNPFVKGVVPSELLTMRKTGRSKRGSTMLFPSQLPTVIPTIVKTIRKPALELLVALQSLFIPALLLVEIIDAAIENDVPLHAKWNLVTAVKHWHQRRGIER